MFQTLTLKEGGIVGFGGNQKGKIIGICISDLQVSDDEASEAIIISEPTEVSKPEKADTEALSESEMDCDNEENAPPKNTFKYKSSHLEELIIGNKDSPRKTRSSFREEDSLFGLISMIEPTKVEETLSDDAWIVAMHEELNQFERNNVWSLVPKPSHKNIIGTKWVF
ncbi:putative reverse transcriptase (RNA-dependent DNA polymerase), partial [Trifolium medium]|nr:putative reverse transcriptase (RNA-dependent DNA polymerase) [Trifolium medium]